MIIAGDERIHRCGQCGGWTWAVCDTCYPETVAAVAS